MGVGGASLSGCYQDHADGYISHCHESVSLFSFSSEPEDKEKRRGGGSQRTFGRPGFINASPFFLALFQSRANDFFFMYLTKLCCTTHTMPTSWNATKRLAVHD